MLLWCLVVQPTCAYDAVPLRHTVEQIMYVQCFLHTQKNVAVNIVMSYTAAHLHLEEPT